MKNVNLLNHVNVPTGYIDEVFSLSEGKLLLKGWARHPITLSPPTNVIVTCNGRIIASTTAGEARGDVALALNAPEMTLSGWTAVTEPLYLEDGRSIEVYAFNTGDTNAYLIGRSTSPSSQSNAGAANYGQLDSPPWWINVELTQRCNLNCRMCYRHGSGYQGIEMPDPVLHRIRSELFPKAGYVSLNGGGEPLTYSGWDNIVAEISTHNFLPQINSNCVLLNHARGRALVDAGFHLHASIDAATDGTYRYIRGARLAPILERLEEMSAYREATNNSSYELMLICTPMVVNLRELPELVRIAARLGATGLHIQEFSVSAHCHELDPRNVESFAADMYALAIEEGTAQKIKVTAPHIDGVSTTSVNRPEEIQQPAEDNGIIRRLAQRLAIADDTAIQLLKHGVDTFCSYPFIQFYIFADGTVRPCCYRGPFMGTLAEQSFSEIWNGQKWQQFRQLFLAGKLPPTCIGCPTRSDITAFIRNHL